MDKNGITEDVMKTTETVFKSMVFMDINGTEYPDVICIPEKHLTAMVGFAGSYMGLVSIHCSDKFARIVGGSMLRVDADNLSDEDVRDALGEIANIITGQYKARLAEKIQADEQVFRQSIPSIIYGDDYETHTVTNAPRYCAKFETDHESFYVELTLKRT